ncbi:hypothetical protein V7103_22810 [Neobacillus drentensis]|uniref:hypothetical protein n=1 Tax=Neobacillus drentensis TaxID=220684 RepID=UPI002FFDF2E5
MRKSNCEVLVTECRELLPLIEEKVHLHMLTTNDTEIIIPKIKSFIEHCRSILEYCAQDIFQYIIPEQKRQKKMSSKNKNVYFPYGKNKNKFKESIERNLPGMPLGVLYNLIEDLQDYKRSEEDKFLLLMCSLTNENKHNHLSRNQRKGKKYIKVGNFIMADETSTVVVNNSFINGVPTGNFKIKNANIEGDINPLLLRDAIKWESGTYVFKDTNKAIISFLNFCLEEVNKFSILLYKELEVNKPNLN